MTAEVRSPTATTTPTAAPWRVLHVLPDLQIGGGQTIVLNGVRRADRRVWQPYVCQLLDADEMAPSFREAGCPPMAVHHRRGLGAVTVAKLARLIRALHIDLVHVHSPLDRLYGLPAALVTGTPAVAQLHAMWVHFGPNLPEDPNRLQTARAHSLAWVRNRLERRTVRRYGADSANVKALFEPLVDVGIDVTGQAIPIDAFDDAAAAGARARVRSELEVGEGPVLVNVSRLVEGKCQEHLIDLLPGLAPDHPDAVLVLVGDGDRRAALEARAREVGVADQVRFLGNRFDIPALLTAADVFTFSSESEGFGLVALEAMAASLPVIAYRLPALQEFVADGTTGRLVDLGDRAGFAAAVRAVLDDPSVGSRMGREGRRVVEERFHPGATADSFEALYRAVLGPPSDRREER